MNLVLMIVNSQSLNGESAIDSKHSIATMPLQREMAREYAKDHDISIGGEIVIDVDSKFDADSEAKTIIEKLECTNSGNILVTNLEMFNSTGLASKLLPKLTDVNVVPVS